MISGPAATARRFPKKKTTRKTSSAGADPDGGDPVRRHASFLFASRRLLVTTEIEEAAMAADAIIGESIHPVTG